MTRPTDAELFEYREAIRMQAAHLTDEALGRALLDDITGCASAAESEFAHGAEGSAEYRQYEAVVREAAFRLAGVRE